jgi:hypothetical protein
LQREAKEYERNVRIAKNEEVKIANGVYPKNIFKGARHFRILTNQGSLWRKTFQNRYRTTSVSIL